MPKTILIADDEPSLRLLVKASLKNHDYTLVEAVDGKDAFHLAQQVKPDLILLDVMMPYMTGFQVCSEIRKTPEIAHIPVIILTAKGGSDDKQTAQEAGANFFMTKPFRPPELVKAVGFMLQKFSNV